MVTYTYQNIAQENLKHTLANFINVIFNKIYMNHCVQILQKTTKRPVISAYVIDMIQTCKCVHLNIHLDFYIIAYW